MEEENWRCRRKGGGGKGGGEGGKGQVEKERWTRGGGG